MEGAVEAQHPTTHRGKRGTRQARRSDEVAPLDRVRHGCAVVGYWCYPLAPMNHTGTFSLKMLMSSIDKLGEAHRETVKGHGTKASGELTWRNQMVKES